MKDSKDFKKLDAIDKITDDIVLDVDISNIVEKGMEMKMRRDTIKFFIISSIFVSLAGIIALINFIFILLIYYEELKS